MWKSLAILMLVSTPAQSACHKFSTWHYRFPQSCNSKMTAMYIPKMKLRENAPLVQPSHPLFILPPTTNELNVKLNTMLESVVTIPNIPVDILIAIYNFDKERNNVKERSHALEKLKDRLR